MVGVVLVGTVGEAFAVEFDQVVVEVAIASDVVGALKAG